MTILPDALPNSSAGCEQRLTAVSIVSRRLDRPCARTRSAVLAGPGRYRGAPSPHRPTPGVTALCDAVSKSRSNVDTPDPRICEASFVARSNHPTRSGAVSRHGPVLRAGTPAWRDGRSRQVRCPLLL